MTRDAIVWVYSGVRPLYDKGGSAAQAATRDYVLSLDADRRPPLLSIFGGKITTYRRLAEHALSMLEPFFPDEARRKGGWSGTKPLPGGDFPVDGFDALVAALRRDWRFLPERDAWRLARLYGTTARDILGAAHSLADLGRAFGAGLSEAEVAHLMRREWARTAEDVVWRRTKLGLRMSPAEVEALDVFMAEAWSRQKVA